MEHHLVLISPTRVRNLHSERSSQSRACCPHQPYEGSQHRMDFPVAIRVVVVLISPTRGSQLPTNAR